MISSYNGVKANQTGSNLSSSSVNGQALSWSQTLSFTNTTENWCLTFAGLALTSRSIVAGSNTTSRINSTVDGGFTARMNADNNLSGSNAANFDTSANAGFWSTTQIELQAEPAFLGQMMII